MDHAKKAISGLSCSVKECTYHTTDNKCSAEEVKVGCGNSCCSSCDTECVTIRPRG